MKNQRLGESKVKVASIVVAVDRDLKLDSLRSLSFLEFPHWGLDLDCIRL